MSDIECDSQYLSFTSNRYLDLEFKTAYDLYYGGKTIVTTL